jgi:hypothetical protein
LIYLLPWSMDDRFSPHASSRAIRLFHTVDRFGID